MQDFRDTVNKLAELKAAVAELQKEEKKLIAEIKAEGPGKYEGETHVLTVTVGERRTLDMKAVRAKLSAQFIRAHTNITEVTKATLRAAA